MGFALRAGMLQAEANRVVCDAADRLVSSAVLADEKRGFAIETLEQQPQKRLER